MLRLRSISVERQRKGDGRRKRKCDFGFHLQDSSRPEGRRTGVGPSAGRGRAGRRGPSGRRAPGRGGVAGLPTSALQNACCGCTGEQLQASAGRSSVPSSRRPSASHRLRAAAPMAGGGAGTRGRGARGSTAAAAVRALASGRAGAARGSLRSAGAPSAPGPRSPAQTFPGLCRGPERGRGTRRRRRRRRLAGGRGRRGSEERARPAAGGCHGLLWMRALRARAEPAFYCAPRRAGSAPQWRAANAAPGAPGRPLPARLPPSPEPALLCPDPQARLGPAAAHLAPGRAPQAPAAPQPRPSHPRSPEVGVAVAGRAAPVAGGGSGGA